MSELYSEFLVKKESTFKDALIKFGMIGLTVVAAAAGLFLNPLLLKMCIRERIRGKRFWKQPLTEWISAPEHTTGY